ncbi:hypothetical protein [Rickettsiella massiliensis]|uniref:hypothetical protein n=1 Tax=Rickettsiella massiliensis TaxID=676517 RepID=UPI0002D86257|nr:hypothetical protein [Rickettsiella massiliensis]
MHWIKIVTQRILFFILIAQINIGNAAFENKGDIKDQATIKEKNDKTSSSLSQEKPPSIFIIERYKEIKTKLPFDDTRDFAEAKKGLIAKPTYQKIMADAGNVAWDMSSYHFCCKGKS